MSSPSPHKLGSMERLRRTFCIFCEDDARAISDAFDSPQPREDYRDVFEKLRFHAF